MKLSDIAQCEKTLDFRPVATWPEALPSFCWDSLLLCGFSRQHGPAVDLSHSEHSLAKVFNSIYPHLSLPEFARLYVIVSSLPWADSFLTEFASLHGWRLSKDLIELMAQLVRLPMKFQNWVSLRDLGARELAILKAAPDIDFLIPITQEIARRSPSRATGVQMLELAGELKLMGETLVFDTQLTDDQWLQQLKRQRHPLTAQKDESQNNRMRALPWPAHLQTRWLRTGDEAGVEIKFTATSFLDLKRKVDGLRLVEQILEKNPQNLWSN